MYKTKKASYLPNRPNDFQDINNLANTVLFNCFRASVKWRRRKENKGETEAPRSNGGGGGRSHLASILLEERTSLSILFSSKAGHRENHLRNVCVRVCARESRTK